MCSFRLLEVSMIYLIGGPPRCGKTTVAKRVVVTSGASLLSCDWIEGVVSRYVPQSVKAQLFPKNDIRRRAEQSNDIMYRRHSAEEIVSSYTRQAETSCPALEELIRRAVSAESDFVLEGFQVSPSVMRAAIELYGPENVTALILVRNDHMGIVDDCRKSTAQHDWFLEKSTDPTTHPLIADMIVSP